MTGNAWLVANKVTQQEYHLAQSILMTGPKATKPTYRAIRKTIGRLRRGEGPGDHGWGSWRSAKSV